MIIGLDIDTVKLENKLGNKLGNEPIDILLKLSTNPGRMTRLGLKVSRLFSSSNAINLNDPIT
ncbi:hypothetical protein SAMN05720354_10968 [Nitrosospira sp. Nsp1]|nr:hypothetical protein SAMN05720354_10968 [Nitrosospira sp. Nsp1]